MNKFLASTLLFLPISATASLLDPTVSQMACYPVNGQIKSSTGAAEPIGESVQFDNTIETTGPIFVPVNEVIQVQGAKPYYCDNLTSQSDALKCQWDYYNGNDASEYAWWEVNDSGQASHITGFSGTRRLDYVSLSRGASLLAGVIINDWHQNGDFGYIEKIPVCEGIEVYRQNRPTGTASVSGGAKVSGTVYPSIDSSFSKFGVEGQSALISWTLAHYRYHEASYTITSRSTNLNFYPEYRGLYAVYVTINDGTYEHSFIAGDVYFTGGMESCFSCDNNEIP